MKHYNKRVARIADELISFFLSVGGSNIDLKIEVTADYYKFYFKTNYLAKNEKEIAKFCKLMNCPKQSGIEEYYGGLAGESDIDSEIYLVGMMVEQVEVNYLDDHYLELKFYKYKQG